MPEVYPQVSQPTWPAFQQAYGNWLFNTFNNTQGGVPGYTGALNPELSQTLFPSLWSAYSPQGGSGMAALQQMLAGGLSTPSQANQKMWSDTAQYGGPAGYPTQLMSLLAQYGASTDYGPGKYYNNMWQTGMPNQSSMLSTIAKQGGSGRWGQLLQQRAMGMPSGGAMYLLPFLTGKPYAAPRVGG